jgi:translin
VGDIQSIIERIRAHFDELDQAREHTLVICRQVVRESADTIRAIHRGETEKAAAALRNTNEAVRELSGRLASHPQLVRSGFVQDAQKEHAEAQITHAVITGEDLPSPDDIGVSCAAYVNGAAEAIGELRRHVVDSIRVGRLDCGEDALGAMNDIYYALVSLDYPDAILQGLKRRTDAVRSTIEYTRSDLTRALRQERLEAAMHELEMRLGSRGHEPEA